MTTQPRSWAAQHYKVLPAVAGALTLLATGLAMPDEPDKPTTSSAVLGAARSHAENTRVRVMSEDTTRTAKLLDRPLIRYSDQPRKAYDSTLWLWLDGDRPVAVQKVEAALNRDTGERKWVFCFASLTDGPSVSAEWPFGFEFRSKESGLQFQPVPGAPPPAESSRLRRSQLRTISREFNAELTLEPISPNREQMRMLPHPLYEYPEGDEQPLRGGIIGFASYGTNPSLLLVLEVRPDQDGTDRWHYSAARLMNCGFAFRHREQVVSSRECDPWVPGAKHATLTYFWIPRQEKLEFE